VCVCVCVRSLIEVLEALLPVGSPSNIPALIQQFDAVEVQHEGIGCQESPLGFPSALEFLTGVKYGRSEISRQVGRSPLC